MGLKSLWFVAARLTVLYACLCALVFIFQRRLLYFPSHNSVSSRLKPWMEDGDPLGFCRAVDAPETVWLLFHGNGGQAAHRDYVLDHLPAGDSLYVLEYPGYGARAGSPSRASIDAAASEAFRRLQRRHPTVPVCVIGESLGSGPACALSREPVPPAKMVLITPFDTLARVAAGRFFFLPAGLLLRDRWDNCAALNAYAGPVDIFAAKHDAVIPIAHARSLAAAAPRARFIQIACGHNDWSSSGGVRISRN